eukprot:g32301.t1
MGRRRAAAKPPAKARQKLDTMFNCLFCSSLKAVEVKMVRLEKIGFLWPGLDILLTRRVGDASSPLPMFCRYLLAADLRFPSLFESKG